MIFTKDAFAKGLDFKISMAKKSTPIPGLSFNGKEHFV